MKLNYSFPKQERLKSKKIINELFDDGLVHKCYPIIFFYKKINPEQIKRQNSPSGIFMGVSVSKRIFRSAVNRNKIKRQMREAYRLNKFYFLNSDAQYQSNDDAPYAIMAIYSAKTKLPFEEISKAMKLFFIHLSQKSKH